MSENVKSKWTPEYCAYANALRDFEKAHQVWMNTSVFTPEGVLAKFEKECAMDKYDKARKIWEKSIRSDNAL